MQIEKNIYGKIIIKMLEVLNHSIFVVIGGTIIKLIDGIPIDIKLAPTSCGHFFLFICDIHPDLVHITDTIHFTLLIL